MYKSLIRLIPVCVFAVLFCSAVPAFGQLTAIDPDGKEATEYRNARGNFDTVFVFNQEPLPRRGNLLLQQSGLCTFNWHRFDYGVRGFEKQPFLTVENAVQTSQDGLEQGGYMVTVTPQGETAPCDTFVAWLYMNQGFSFNLHKDSRGEVIYNYKSCYFTDFRLNPNTVQQTFTYYDPGATLPDDGKTLNNAVTFTMRRGNEAEVEKRLDVQGTLQYLRDNSPPYEDTDYYFRAYDRFGIEREDEIRYVSIIPHAVINDPVLPDKDPTSAPVPVKFTCTSHNAVEYEWLFGDGDSIKYDLEHLAPDTVMHAYITPARQGYQVSLKVTSLLGCVYTAVPVEVTVDSPRLDVANVFTPNNDGRNDYFRPFVTSLRQFEIRIYTRAGQQIYHYRGDDLRDWQGWDGKINNTGRDAAVGVYYYTIRALGWDNPSTRNPQAGPYSGAFHLYR